ncbi:hypothetical protein GJAV_G00171920 [Gymnothorax javanicus]|nr:hypothetical protein GJAV_G00171920 [Gymnothorax javanicus]
MQKVWLLLFLFAAVYAESQVRETETWMPTKAQTDGPQDDPVASGDFGFVEEEDDDEEDDDDDYYDYNDYPDEYDDEDDDDEEISGSGDGDDTDVDIVPTKPDVIDNKIPEPDTPKQEKPLFNDIEVLNNEVVPRVAAQPDELQPNVLMSHASEEGVFSKPEVLAALIAGGAVGLLFAILLILLLIYRMKKKDEGSYDLGKKPIYTKAPTTEIYA